jgi:hypothetical protein
MLRRHPDRRKQTSGVQLGKCERSFGIGLDGNARDQGHMRRMDQCHRLDQGLEFVIDLEGIGGHLEHDRVGLGQMLPAPIGKLSVGNPMRTEDERLLCVDPNGNQVVLVNIKPNVALGSIG